MCSSVIALFFLFGKVVAALSECLDMPASTFLLAFGILCGSYVLFTGPTNFFFSKTFIKNGSHGIIHTFKNYFAIVFSIFSFSKINSIHTDPEIK